MRASALVLAILLAGLLAPSPSRAASELSNGQVDPLTGTTETVFAFRVDYTSDAPDLPSVYAVVGEATVQMSLASGLPNSGTYVGSAQLPAGTWDVTFHADVLQGPDADLAGPTVTVVEEGATPSPTLSPTAKPTARPTPPPTPSPSPTPVPTIPPTPTPTPTPRATPGGFAFTPSPSPTPVETTPSPTATPQPEIEAAGARLEFGPLLMLFIGGTAAGSGAALLGVYWAARRGRVPYRAG